MYYYLPKFDSQLLRAFVSDFVDSCIKFGIDTSRGSTGGAGAARNFPTKNGNKALNKISNCGMSNDPPAW